MIKAGLLSAVVAVVACCYRLACVVDVKLLADSAPGALCMLRVSVQRVCILDSDQSSFLCGVPPQRGDIIETR